MKKIRIVQIIGFILFVIYVLLIISEFIWGYLADLNLIVFSGVLAIVSITMITKGVLLKSASTLWFAISLILFAICIISSEIFKIPREYGYLLALIPIIASLVNIAIFHNLFYIKIIIVNISVFIPLLIVRYVSLQWWWSVIIFAISIILGIIICRNISLEKENING